MISDYHAQGSSSTWQPRLRSCVSDQTRHWNTAATRALTHSHQFFAGSILRGSSLAPLLLVPATERVLHGLREIGDGSVTTETSGRLQCSRVRLGWLAASDRRLSLAVERGYDDNNLILSDWLCRCAAVAARSQE